ncbi:MAG: D-alanine--D-alanine ligase, partial [Candidatus Tectomicrobia bacterium]|nr:D-alanine--D-alanine ligase [Candidatus Tectomicrobia bacterium]
MGERIKVAVIFGGRSPEHEVSVASALSVIQALDQEQYEVVPVKISKEGRWLSQEEPVPLSSGLEGLPDRLQAELSLDLSHRRWLLFRDEGSGPAVRRIEEIGVIFPVIHGPYGEDGTLQGLLEMMDLPYVGCEVAASAIGMDKGFMKILFRAAGLPGPNFLLFKRAEWIRHSQDLLQRSGVELGYPVFVKPVNQGSTIGISKAREEEELRSAIALACQYSEKIIVEAGIDCRELECSVLGNQEPQASVVAEIVPSREYYDYESKYTPNLAELRIPAPIPEEVARQVQEIAVKAFQVLDCVGMARVDFFWEKSTGRLYLNELNTIPGFTATSGYPKMWEASGLPYPQLLDRLIELALERYQT